MVKGETLLDTARNIEAMQADIIVLRHSSAGAVETLAQASSLPSSMPATVARTSDSGAARSTPSAAAAWVLWEAQRWRLSATSHTAAWPNVQYFRAHETRAEVRVVGPPTMIPLHINQLGARVYYNLDEGLRGVHVIMMLRLQLERQGAPCSRPFANMPAGTA